MEPRERTRSHGPGRAVRFALHLPVRYRMAGESEWHAGTTENISRSGAAIRGENPIAPARAVEVAILLPSIGSNAGGCLRGEGQVVRSLAPSSQMGGSVFAVAVARYRLDRGE